MKKRICVVDDDSSVRESLKKVLEETGYEVILAADGKEAEGKLEDPMIELLILDLNMPNRDGWDVLEEANSNQPLMPVLIITGMMDQLATTAIPGVAALMSKPIDVSTLLKKIEYLLAESPEARLRRMIGSVEAEPWLRAVSGGRTEFAKPRSDFSNQTRRAGNFF
jgi:DNA-binding response OmpR family regulator